MDEPLGTKLLKRCVYWLFNEGERPADVAASFGLHRSWAFKCRAAARGRGNGLRALRSTKATGHPRKLMPTQEQQVFRWVNGKNPQQYGFDFGLWTPAHVKVVVASLMQPAAEYQALRRPY